MFVRSAILLLALSPIVLAAPVDFNHDIQPLLSENCYHCHGPDGKGLIIAGNAAAPPLAGSQRLAGDKELLIKILLNGLSGPVDGNTYNNVMAPFGATNNDEWVASVLSYTRYNFAKDSRRVSPVVTADEVKKVRSQTAGRTNLWTMEELKAEVKQP